MGNKTRRNRKIQKGGKTLRNLPIKPDIRTGRDLEKYWEFFYLSAHGTTEPELFTNIPKDTYVIFNSVAGKSSYLYGQIGFAYANLVYQDTKEEFYEDMLKEIKTKNGMLKTGQSWNTVPSENLTRAIYEPHTEIPDMFLHFKNDHRWGKVVALGLFKLPVTSIELLQAFKDNYNATQTRNINAYNEEELLDSEYFDEKYFKDTKYGNLLPQVIGDKILLSKLFTMLPPIEEGKKRFIFIVSCRHPSVNNDEKNTFARILRANSLGKREDAEPSVVKKADYASKLLHSKYIRQFLKNSYFPPEGKEGLTDEAKNRIRHAFPEIFTPT
jgi:hypothetical protein